MKSWSLILGWVGVSLVLGLILLAQQPSDSWAISRVAVPIGFLVVIVVVTRVMRRRGYVAPGPPDLASTPSSGGQLGVVAPGEATLEIVRESALKLSPWAFDIRVDEALVGQVSNNAKVSLVIAPGPHHVRVAMDCWASRPVEINPSDGQVVHLECRPRPGFVGWWAGTTRPAEYLRLRETPRLRT